MVKDEIIGALASTFPDAALRWQDSDLRVDGPIHVDAPILDSPAERPHRRAREIVLTFERGILERLDRYSPLERAQSFERLEKHVETAMAGYDDGRSAATDAPLEPFVIRCGDFLVD